MLTVFLHFLVKAHSLEDDANPDNKEMAAQLLRVWKRDSLKQQASSSAPARAADDRSIKVAAPPPAGPSAASSAPPPLKKLAPGAATSFARRVAPVASVQPVRSSKGAAVPAAPAPAPKPAAAETARPSASKETRPSVVKDSKPPAAKAAPSLRTSGSGLSSLLLETGPGSGPVVKKKKKKAVPPKPSAAGEAANEGETATARKLGTAAGPTKKARIVPLDSKVHPKGEGFFGSAHLGYKRAKCWPSFQPTVATAL